MGEIAATQKVFNCGGIGDVEFVGIGIYGATGQAFLKNIV